MAASVSDPQQPQPPGSPTPTTSDRSPRRSKYCGTRRSDQPSSSSRAASTTARPASSTRARRTASRWGRQRPRRPRPATAGPRCAFRRNRPPVPVETGHRRSPHHRRRQRRKRRHGMRRACPRPTGRQRPRQTVALPACPWRAQSVHEDALSVQLGATPYPGQRSYRLVIRGSKTTFNSKVPGSSPGQGTTQMGNGTTGGFAACTDRRGVDQAR